MAFAVASNKQERYQWIQKMLAKWHYPQRPRQEKGLLLKLLAHVSGYSPAQLKRLVKQQRETGKVAHRPAQGNRLNILLPKVHKYAFANRNTAHARIASHPTQPPA